MNRNFATFALIIWLVAWVVSGSSNQLGGLLSSEEKGTAMAELAGKIFTVFVWIWFPLFILIALQALVKYGKEENKKPFDWSSMK